MKLSPLILQLLLSNFAFPCYSQNITMNDSLLNKSVDDFSNRRYINLTNLVATNSKLVGTTIVIINKKIYSLDSEEYKLLKKESIINMEVIKDEFSKTIIKNIIMIDTK